MACPINRLNNSGSKNWYDLSFKFLKYWQKEVKVTHNQKSIHTEPAFTPCHGWSDGRKWPQESG